MKNFLAIILVAIMIFSFAGCGNSGTEIEIEKESESTTKSETETEIIVDYGITYPILFNMDNNLYWIKNCGEYPILVDDGSFFSEDYKVRVNPTNPNKIIRFDRERIKEFYLDTSPEAEGDIINMWYDKDYIFINCYYTPDGKYIYSYDNTDTIRVYNTDIKIKNVCDYIFEEGKSKCFYATYPDSVTGEVEVAFIDIESGWKETILSIESDGFYIDEVTEDYIYCHYYTKDGNNSEIYNMKTNVFEERKYDFVSESTNTYIDSITYEMEIKNQKFSIFTSEEDSIWSSDYITVIKLENGNVLCAYSLNDLKEKTVVLFTDNTHMTVLDDPDFYFIQPLNNYELLFLETTDSGYENLVIYDMMTEEFTIVFDDFSGELFITYNLNNYIMKY